MIRLFWYTTIIFLGIVVTAKARADERVRVVKNKNRTLEERLQEAQNKIEYQDAST